MLQFKNKNGKVIGQLANGVFTKRVVESKHLLRMWDAYGIQDTVMDKLPPKTIIKIIDDKGGIYQTTVEDFLHNGKVNEFGEHGRQWFLSRKYFNGGN